MNQRWLRRATGAFAVGALLGVVVPVVLPGSRATAGSTTLPTQTFSSAGTYYVTVPGPIDYIDLHGLGGAGFAGDGSSGGASSGGGAGSGTSVSVRVTNGAIGGDQLKIVVGAKGGGGYRGYGSELSGAGGNGGGATVISNAATGQVLLIAGGGGGGGGGSGLFVGYNGGHGGTNGNGSPGIGTFGGNAGRGGAAGTISTCFPTWVTQGGTGESAPSGSGVAGGGGGGEGACDGGGQSGGSGDHGAGSGGGGGGGSGASYADPFGTGGTFLPGANTGDGSASVTFTTYDTSPPTITSPSCIYTGDLSAPTFLSQQITAVGYPAPSLTLLNAPSWLSVFSESQTADGHTALTLHAEGPVPSPQLYQMQAQASNSAGSIIDPLAFVVGVTNPTFISPSSATATVGKPFSFKAIEIGCPLVTEYALTNVGTDISWLTLNSNSGELSGTPSAAAVGTHTLTIVANGPTGQLAVQDFTLNVETTVPSEPTAVAASAGNGSAVVSFTPPGSDGGSAITGYTVTATDHTNVGGGGQTATGSASPLTVDGLTNGDSYTFTVTATNSVGTSAPSLPSAPVTPARSATTTTLSSNLNPANVGLMVSFKATVSPASASGTIEFTGPDGTALTGCDAQPVVSGAATCEHTFSGAGSYAITATYSGDATYAGSSSSLTQQVDAVQAPTTTINVSTPGPSTGPAHVTISATGAQSTITTRCVLDPQTAPNSYADLPSGQCGYLGKGGDVTGRGTHTVYAASQDSDGNTEAPVRSATFTINRVAPPAHHVGPTTARDSAPPARVRGTGAGRVATAKTTASNTVTPGSSPSEVLHPAAAGQITSLARTGPSALPLALLGLLLMAGGVTTYTMGRRRRT